MSAAVLPLRTDSPAVGTGRLSAVSLRRQQESLIERLTICISEVEDGFGWEVLDWQGRPLPGCTGNGVKGGYPSFNAAWMAAIDEASQIGARTMTEYRRHRSEF
jgi:hypothetical protein